MINNSQKSIVSKVKSDIEKLGLIKKNDRVAVALSGGPDSVCLLIILKELKDRIGFDLFACHFNHRLRAEESDKDEDFVRSLCKKLDLECFFGRAERDNLYKSEEEARVARYAFFEKILEGESIDLIALAHNQNDLAETLLFRLIRGTGISGLRAIPVQRKNFIRPLLKIPKNEILVFLKKRGQAFRLDKTNLDIRYRRNFIRHKIIPTLTEINPNIIETLASSAKQAEDDYSYILEETKKYFLNITLSESKREIVLSYKDWLRLHPSIKKSLLRLSISKIDTLADITAKQLDEVVNMLNKGVGRKKKILPRKLQIKLFNDKITIFRTTRSS